MLKLGVSKQALNFVADLPPKQFRQVLKKVLSLLENPLPHDSKNLEGSLLKRTDIGEYRIIYYLEDRCVNILLIGKRNDGEVYRDMKRLEK